MTKISSWCPQCEDEMDVSSMKIDGVGIQAVLSCGHTILSKVKVTVETHVQT